MGLVGAVIHVQAVVVPAGAASAEQCLVDGAVHADAVVAVEPSAGGRVALDNLLKGADGEGSATLHLKTK